MKKILLLIVLTIFLYSIVYSKPYTIGFIPMGTSHDFWFEVEKGALEAAKKLNVNLIYRGPNYEGDTYSQIKVVEAFVEKKVDAIVLAPNHKTDLVPAVEKAVINGIKVIIIDSLLDSDCYESFIATDNFLAGKTAGEKLAKIMGNKGKAGLIRFKEGNSSTELREAGFLEVMKEKNIEVVVDEYGGVTIGTAYRKGLEILSKKLGITGFFTPTETLTIGMEKALEESNLAGKIALVGFDLNKDIDEGIKKGSINGVIVQQPQIMGYLGVKTAVDALDGKKVEKKIIVDVNFKTK